MAYLFDNKKNTEHYIVPMGTTPTLTAFTDTQIAATFSIGTTNIYTFPTARAPGPNYILQDTLGNGQLQWVLSSLGSSNFKRITDTGTDYVLNTTDDYGVEIVSDTYVYITLPPASGNAGRSYLLSRASNTDISLRTQLGDDIDGKSSQLLNRKKTRLTVLSNGVNSWYIV